MAASGATSWVETLIVCVWGMATGLEALQHVREAIMINDLPTKERLSEFFAMLNELYTFIAFETI